MTGHQMKPFLIVIDFDVLKHMFFRNKIRGQVLPFAFILQNEVLAL